MHLKKPLLISVFVIGFSALIVQIILLREFLNIFYGNELVVGIVLANWMLLNGFGAYAGKLLYDGFQKFKLLISLLLIISLIPLLTVFCLNIFRNIFFEPGVVISPVSSFISSFLLLMPWCLISGFIFTLFCVFLAKEGRNAIVKVYRIDVLGSVIGALAFSLVMIHFLNAFLCLMVVMIIIMLNAVMLSFAANEKIMLFFSAALILLSGWILNNFDIEKIARDKLFFGQEVVETTDTPYGNITVTRTAEQFNFFENGVFLFSSQNLIQKEEDVHYAMLQHHDPKNVLLIGAGVSGALNEIAKYRVYKTDYLEINPKLVQIALKYNNTPFEGNYNIICEDAVLYLKKLIPKNINYSDRYDIALINVPSPANAQTNRFYTIEFFQNLKKILKQNAVLSISISSGYDYITPEAKKLNSVLHNTLKKLFSNVMIIPGEKNYFIASDIALNPDIAALSEKKGIDNVYINKYYIDDKLLKNRSNILHNSIDKKTIINTDFFPVAYYFQLQYWLSFFSDKERLFYRIFVIILVAATIMAFVAAKPLKLCLFSNGFVASSLQFLMLIYFQVLYGYVYSMLGILIALFMLGLFVGAFLPANNAKIISKKKLSLLLIGLGIYSIAIPFVLLMINHFNLNPTLIQIIFFLIVIDIGALSGMIFSFSVSLQNESISSIAARSYSFDMLGSAIGLLLVSALILPLLGLIGSSLVIGAIIILSGILLIRT